MVEEVGERRQSAFARDGEQADIIAKKGTYTYVSPEGLLFKTYWTADENGFIAYGDHIPGAPAMSESVSKLFQIDPVELL